MVANVLCRSYKIYTFDTFEVAKAKGYEKLFAYVRGDNERALAAYVKQGFEVVGIAKKHAKVGDVYIDETLIEKLL